MAHVQNFQTASLEEILVQIASLWAATEAYEFAVRCYIAR